MDIFSDKKIKVVTSVEFLVAPSLRAERLIWSLWRVSVRLSVCLYLTEGTFPPPPGNHRISKIPKPKCVSAHSEQLFFGGGPVKGKIFDTRFGLIHVQTGKKKFFEKNFFFANFFLHPFHRIS